MGINSSVCCKNPKKIIKEFNLEKDVEENNINKLKIPEDKNSENSKQNNFINPINLNSLKSNQDLQKNSKENYFISSNPISTKKISPSINIDNQINNDNLNCNNLNEKILIEKKGENIYNPIFFNDENLNEKNNKEKNSLLIPTNNNIRRKSHQINSQLISSKNIPSLKKSNSLPILKGTKKENSKENFEKNLKENSNDKISHKSFPLKFPKFSELDYNSNSENFSLKDFKKYHRTKRSKSLMKLVKHVTFRENKINFNEKFIEDLNNARKDIPNFLTKLKNLSIEKNLKILEENFNTIKDQNFKKISEIDEDKISESLKFFEKLNLDLYINSSKKKELNPLIQIDDFNLPIPKNIKELEQKFYLKKFKLRFKQKFSDKFKLKKIRASKCSKDLDISFNLIFFRDIERWKFLFRDDVDYIGIDYLEFEEYYIFTIVMVRDRERENKDYRDNKDYKNNHKGNKKDKCKGNENDDEFLF